MLTVKVFNLAAEDKGPHWIVSLPEAPRWRDCLELDGELYRVESVVWVPIGDHDLRVRIEVIPVAKIRE